MMRYFLIVLTIDNLPYGVCSDVLDENEVRVFNKGMAAIPVKMGRRNWHPDDGWDYSVYDFDSLDLTKLNDMLEVFDVSDFLDEHFVEYNTYRVRPECGYV